MKNNNWNYKKNNKGFSLFAVIVAIAFTGILGMLVVYIAMSNFYMKITDWKGKDSFYTAEQAIEEIRVGLQEVAGDAMSEAYIQVLEEYEGKSDSDTPQDEERQLMFCKLFYTRLNDKLQEILNSSHPVTDSILQDKYVDLKVGENETLQIVDPALVVNPDPATQADKITKKSKIKLNNMKAIYVDPKGRASIIKTDIWIGIPEVKFATPSTLPDLMSMVVVANGGIVCESDPDVSTEGNKLSGSIYAGKIDGENLENKSANQKDVSILVKPNGKLSVLSGKYLVCSDEVNVGTNSSFTSQSGVSLWARGLTLKSATVNLLGNTYFSDDLTVASGGTASDITIAGNYYGYGSVESAKDSKCAFADFYKSHSEKDKDKNLIYNDKDKDLVYKDNDLNSAIAINGKSTRLDLSGVQKLMLAGKNYISQSDVKTGESITVKGTQLAYLAPAEILGSDGTDSSSFTNPMTYEDSKQNNLDSDSVPVKWNTPVESWGNRTLSQIGVSETQPIQKIYDQKEQVVYFYLNFENDENAASFMSMYYQKNPEMKKKMDQYLSFYFQGENSGIYVKDSQAYLMYVTNGNILSYEGGEKAEGNLHEATHSQMSAKLLNDQIRYQNEWYALNRKMVEDMGDLEQNVKDPDDPASGHDEDSINQSVFDNLVNEKKLRKYVENKPDKIYQYPEGSSSPSIIMANNASNSKYDMTGTGKTLVITSDMAENLRLVVCTGDVQIGEVKSNKEINFKGIIMTDGKITLQPKACLEAAPVEAAKIFQQQIDDGAGNIKAQDFFWMGDQYVLGNTTDTSQNANKDYTTYDLADCVTYRNWKKE